jgi:XTP/dITP diphosphohydrolase
MQLLEVPEVWSELPAASRGFALRDSGGSSTRCFPGTHPSATDQPVLRRPAADSQRPWAVISPLPSTFLTWLWLRFPWQGKGGLAVLVLGTHNPKKREEIVAILDGLGLEFGDLNQWPELSEVVEDEETFVGNARKKATELARALHHWVLGEDSGLVVGALNGRPGVHSARYAGRHGDDDANNNRLLAEMIPLAEDQRGAFYVCVGALADPEGEVQAVVEGHCHGVIIGTPRGSGGFGYDPLFLIPEYHRTFGELSPRVKHALSHRARVLTQLRPALRRLRHEKRI